MSLLEDLVEYIRLASLCTGDGIDAFRDFIPDAPDVLLAIFEYDSIPGGKGDDSIIRYVQINARHTGATSSKAKADEVWRLFNQPFENITDLPNGRWAVIEMKSTPLKTDEDDRRRVIYSFNMAITTTTD